MSQDIPQAPRPSENYPAPEAQFQLRFERFSAFVEEFTESISLGGMFLKTREPRPVGTVVAFDIRLADGFQLLCGQGEVVWMRPDGEGSDEHPGMGIRFQAMDDKGRELILKILEENLKGGGQPFEVTEIPPGAVSTAMPAAGAVGALGGLEAPWGENLPDLPQDFLEEGESPGPAAAGPPPQAPTDDIFAAAPPIQPSQGEEALPGVEGAFGALEEDEAFDLEAVPELEDDFAGGDFRSPSFEAPAQPLPEFSESPAGADWNVQPDEDDEPTLIGAEDDEPTLMGDEEPTLVGFGSMGDEEEPTMVSAGAQGFSDSPDEVPPTEDAPNFAFAPAQDFPAQETEAASPFGDPAAGDSVAEPMAPNLEDGAAMGGDAFAADTSAADSFAADSFAADSFAADPPPSDSFAADAFTADSFAADPLAADSFAAGSSVPDSAAGDSLAVDPHPVASAESVQGGHDFSTPASADPAFGGSEAGAFSAEPSAFAAAPEAAAGEFGMDAVSIEPSADPLSTNPIPTSPPNTYAPESFADPEPPADHEAAWSQDSAEPPAYPGEDVGLPSGGEYEDVGGEMEDGSGVTEGGLIGPFSFQDYEHELEEEGEEKKGGSKKVVLAGVAALVLATLAFVAKDPVLNLLGMGSEAVPTSPPNVSETLPEPAATDLEAEQPAVDPQVGESGMAAELPPPSLPSTARDEEGSGSDGEEFSGTEAPSSTLPPPTVPPPSLPSPPPPTVSTAPPPSVVPPPPAVRRSPASSRSSASSFAASARRLLEISTRSTSGGTLVVIRVDGKISPSQVELNPLDYNSLLGQITLDGIEEDYPGGTRFDTPELRQIRTGLHPGPKLRMVFDYAQEGTGLGTPQISGDTIEVLVRRP